MWTPKGTQTMDNKPSPGTLAWTDLTVLDAAAMAELYQMEGAADQEPFLEIEEDRR